MTSPLAKCPFCGGTVKLGAQSIADMGWGDSAIHCRRCKVTMEGDAPSANPKADEELIARWNTRAKVRRT